MQATKRLNPLNDFLFQKIFGEKGGEEALLSLLNAVLEREGNDFLESIEILEDKTLTGDVVQGKEIILDVRAVTKDNTKINIEVQLKNLKNMDKRSLFYWSREFTRGIASGDDYRKLPKVIAINIVNFNFIDLENFHTSFHLWEDKRKDYLLTDLLEIHFIDMPKFRKLTKTQRDLQSNKLHRWLTFFDIRADDDLVKEVEEMDETIQKVSEKIKHLSTDKETLRAYELRELALSDYTTGMNVAREEGHAEGLEEGIDLGIKKMIREMLKQNADEQFIKSVAKISDEELDQIKKEVLV